MENISFDTDLSSIDIVGSDILVDATGTIFTIQRSGLYQIEWNVNLQTGTQPVILCLLENGEPSSAISATPASGNVSSGALLHVTDADLPFTVSLHNFGGEITITDPVGFENTVAAIRILRFADGPSA